MSEIHKALLKAQAQFEGVKPNAVNPQFRSKYAKLGSIVEAISAPLTNAGITFRWHTERTEHGWVMTCTLTHAESGESISCDWPVIAAKQDAQGFASGSTYARRYSLLAVTGIPTDEDDDGEAAVKSTTGQQRAAQVAAAKAQRQQVKPDTVAPGYPRRGDPDHGGRVDENGVPF